MIISGGIIGGAIPSITRTDTGSYNSAATTTITFASRNLGAAGRKHIGIAAGWFALPNLTAVTVAGISATQVLANAVAGGRESAIWIAPVPSDTAGDVVLTFAGTVTSAHIGVYALYNLQSATAVDTGSDTGATGSTYFLDLSANVSSGGVVMAVFAGAGVTAVPSPTGLSNEVALFNPGLGTRVFAADYTATLAETPRTMGWTLEGFVAGCLATFR